MKTPGFFLNLAILFALQVPFSGLQIKHAFTMDAPVAFLAAAALSPLYPVGCAVAWFGAVDRLGWHPLFATVVFFALFMATVLNMLMMRRMGRMQSAAGQTAASLDQTHSNTDKTSSGADKS
ncbi:MAG: hypothetical protein JNM47_00330 [Hyphomonadaceae bacterium]|nr:hypothetical protein [Hyphomonadaceae bacterium]